MGTVMLSLLASIYYNMYSYFKKELSIRRCKYSFITNDGYYTLIEPNHLFEGHGHVEYYNKEEDING